MGILKNRDHERFCSALHARLWDGEKAVSARVAAYRDTIYRGDNPEGRSLVDNARKLVQRKDIKARLAEMARESADMSELYAAWCMVEFKRLYLAARSFNWLDLLNADRDGFDLSKATSEQLALISEISIENEDGKVRVKLKGPDKTAVLPLMLRDMARIGGWEAPKKIAATTPEGKAITLADLIGASMIGAKKKPDG